MRFLGLDVGTKTVGLSISDKTNNIAIPYKTLFINEEDFESCMAELKNIIEEKEITEIVLGLPKNMDNSLGFAAERSLKFKQVLTKYFDLPIHLIDERLSTVEAEKILIKSDVSRKKRKKNIDNVASAIILDTYLKERKSLDEQNL